MRPKLAAALAAFALACAAGEAAPPSLRVGTSGDYAPFSARGAGGRSGFDVEVARAYARERGLRLRWVPVRWVSLESDLAAGRFDVVMSGVTVRPERSLAGRFTVPVAKSGAVALVREAGGLRSAEDLDRPQVRIAVNAGGHLERVARRLFPSAQLRPLTPNAAVPEALRAGAADAALSDTLEAPHWLAGTRGFTTLGPLTRDWKAYWLPADAAERARDLGAWLLARESDGTLARLRALHLPEGAREATATPLAALAAAIDERLALMPLVAEAKRATGRPVRDAAQEDAVLARAVAEAREAAARADAPPPADEAVRALFAALIDAAREVQEAALAGPPASASPADLDAALRPALARIGERIAALLVQLPADLDEAAARDALADLSTPGLSAGSRERIARAVLGLSPAGPAARRRAPRSRSRASRGRAGRSALRGPRGAPPTRA